jgi:DNA-directed RNA polymerase specialized sigma24 family protein
LGYSVEEIAVATHVSVNTSKSRLRVAKEYLRRRLDAEA